MLPLSLLFGFSRSLFLRPARLPFALSFSERELFLRRSFSLSSPRLVQAQLNHGTEWVGMCFFSPEDTQTYIHTRAHKHTLWRIPGGLEDAACGSAFWHFSSLIFAFSQHFPISMRRCIMDSCKLPDVWHNEQALANLLIPLRLCGRSSSLSYFYFSSKVWRESMNSLTKSFITPATICYISMPSLKLWGW